MKIAVTYENGEIFQHFGHTEQLKLYEVEDGKILNEQIVDTNGSGHGALAEGITAKEINRKEVLKWTRRSLSETEIQIRKMRLCI